jgi:hypothetical protein
MKGMKQRHAALKILRAFWTGLARAGLPQRPWPESDMAVDDLSAFVPCSSGG